MNAVNEPLCFRLSEPSYHGVLVTWDGGMRLCVSPNGKRYVVQKRSACGTVYSSLSMVASLSKALPLLPSVALAECSGLPEKPLDYPRQWAGDMASAGRVLASAFQANDAYAGVIVRTGNYRLSVTADFSAYVVQRLDDLGRWSNRSRFQTLESVNWAAVPVCLRAAVEKLPLNPADVPLASLAGDLIAATGARGALQERKSANGRQG